MKFPVTLVFVALSCTNLFSQSDPLDSLIVTSTRLKCSLGYAEVTYGYKPTASENASPTLAFVVIQAEKHRSDFRSWFHLNSRVDDVTPPAYIAMPEHTVDLPNRIQLYAVGGGRYRQTDSDVTLAEIRSWLDQRDLIATIDSLVEYKTKIRTAVRKGS